MIIITEPPSLLKSFIAKISLNELARTMAINLGLNVAARILRREDVRALENLSCLGFRRLSPSYPQTFGYATACDLERDGD
jgi:hypothetical protein